MCRYVGMKIPHIYINDIDILPIWLDDVRCNGSEEHIADCSHKVWGDHNCQHSEDVAIACYGKAGFIILYAHYTKMSTTFKRTTKFY